VSTGGDAPQSAGAMIRAARERAGMTQEALGAALGVTQTCVSYWESRKCDIGMADFLRAAEALGVDPETLLPERHRGYSSRRDRARESAREKFTDATEHAAFMSGYDLARSEALEVMTRAWEAW
jgi:transcriptional regulator with XRE-family HTH domain